MFDVNSCTLQEACDYAVLKIVEQGGQCLNESEQICAYGGGEGRHCAVGWLLDHNNEQLMKFIGSISNMADVFDDVPDIISENLTTFMFLQDFHDYDSLANRERRLESLSEYISVDAPQYHQWVEMGV